MNIDFALQLRQLEAPVESVFALAGGKIRDLDTNWDPARGAPVYTIEGKYTTRGWTEWTQGFQYGAALLTFDATGDDGLLELGRDGMRRVMPAHLTHVGVHDHGFNTMSTYGNLLRLAREGRWQATAGDVEHLQLAIRVSGAVQAARWTPLPGGLGYICSFNGPQSLFIDTIRSLRVLAAAHELGQVLMGEHDLRISLLHRLLQHLETTLRYNVFFGQGRDHYDTPGRVVHEALFNVNDGNYRCPSTQQGYSPFSTWTRGLAWAITGCAEMLEYLAEVPAEAVAEAAVPGLATHAEAVQRVGAAAAVTAEFYLANSAADGIPYWDTGAPGLAALGDWRATASDPFNDHEPVDSSAAAIAAQGLLRLAGLPKAVRPPGAERLLAAGLTVARTLFAEPYLATDPAHQGVLLHTVYHRPNGWDHVPEGRRIPCGESCQWGDYHALELALLIRRLAAGGTLPWRAA
ncbi:MAG: hypothetical protein OXC12_07690 [Spirochaetaceae bacterium]|nr:hypothetical protein [Spirochaetaceae bacterium]